MFLLSLQLHGMQQPAHLKFKAEKDARREFDAVVKAIEPVDTTATDLPPATFLNIQDDYGHAIALWSHQIAFPLLVDFDADIACQAEIAVMQQRGNATVQRMIQADPMLKFAMSQGGGVMMPS